MSRAQQTRPARPPRKSRLAQTEVATILDQYREGHSLRTISTSTGRGYGTVHFHVTEAGIMRSRGGRAARVNGA